MSTSLLTTTNCISGSQGQQPTWTSSSLTSKTQQNEQHQQSSPDVLDTATPGITERLWSAMRTYANLSDILRLFGSMFVVGAMFTFLVDGLTMANDQERFLSMLIFTGLLTIAGFTMTWLKSKSSARAFFSLSLTSIPVNFSVIAAMLYSVAPIDGLLGSYPTAMTWTGSSLGSVALMAASSAALLVPLSFLGFSVMSNAHRVPLTGVLLLQIAIMLIPVRSTMIVIPIAAVMLFLAITAIRRMAKKNKAASTLPEKFAKALLFLPVSIVLGRSLWLYGITATPLLMVLAGCYWAVRTLLMEKPLSGIATKMLSILGTGLILLSAATAGELVKSFSLSEWMAPTVLLVMAIMVVDFQRHLNNQTFATWLINLAIGIWSIISMIYFLDSPESQASTFIFAVLAISLLAYGLLKRSWFGFLSGLILVIMAGSGSYDLLSQFVPNSKWIGLALVGAAAIALAPIIERMGVNRAVEAEAQHAVID